MRTYHHQQYVNCLYNNLTKWVRRKSRALSENHLDAAMTLMLINLDSTEDMLESLYAPSHRGRPPHNPVSMLRALLLMVMLGFKSISLWVEELRSKPRLAVIAGFVTESHLSVRTPGIGTFYDFIDRLENGEYQKPCPHYIRPDKLRKGSHLRNITEEKEQRRQEKEDGSAQYDSVTRKLKDELQKNEDRQRPDGLMKRLEDILIKCAVIPSAQRGMLGDLSKLNVCGDGSALPSGANCNGRPSCDCHKNGIYKCDHDRYYTDATANWGYDSYRDRYYFGHTYYQHVINHDGHDLPLHVSIAPASETDYTLSMKDFDRFSKTLREHGLDWQISHTIYDAGHDSLGNYEYLMDDNITPVIALNPRKGVHPSPSGSAKVVNEDGVPVCPAGMVMRLCGYVKKKHRIIYNCPVKRPTHRDGQHLWNTFPEECPHKVLCDTATKMGPVVYVKSTDDPRLYPPLPRNNPKFHELMDKRSCCERSNSTKKVTYHLGERPCRSAAHYLVRLYLVSIIEHAKAWLAEERKLAGDDPLVLLQRAKAA